MGFVTVRKADFEKSLPEGWKQTDVPGCKEIVYDLPTEKDNLFIRVYSTIDSSGLTRDIGTDAIRIVHWDGLNGRPLGKGSKVLRVEGATTIGDRIRSRIVEMLAQCKDIEIKKRPTKDIWRTVDPDYVKAILSSPVMAGNDFAQSLKEKLEKWGNLTDGQVVYVLGDKTPKGRMTMEAEVKLYDPGFASRYLDQVPETSKAPEVPEWDMDDEPLSPPVVRNFKHIDPTEGKDVKLVPTKEFSYFQYKFPMFNPVQSLVFPHRDRDVNLVIGANTSAGKTICAELCIDGVLATGKKVIYLSPLKSLTQEKYDDWGKRYPDREITILTGDYTLSDEMKKKLANSEIVVMTSEMADSRTRKMHSERNFWLKDVGLVIVDESHILSTERGHAVETGLMRFTKLNPKARIILLSATMPNVGELGEWLTSLNGKETEVVFCNWRPVTLDMNYIEYMPVTSQNGHMNYKATEMRKITTAIDIAMSKPDEKFMIFVHSKATGKIILDILRERGETAMFHNADLELEERKEVEDSFRNREGGLRVMVSTSTTAWGVNLPARNVVVVGIHRGMEEVDQLDIIQMAGRAGRFGIDDEGHVYLVIPAGSTAHWEEVFRNPRNVDSVLNKHTVLAFHTLAEIQVREIRNPMDMLRWFRRSLAFKQESNFTEADAEGLIKDLLKMEMVKYGPDGINLTITNLGRVSASLYYSPYDVYSWYRNFNRMFRDSGVNDVYGNPMTQVPMDDMTLAWAVANLPSNDWGYIPKDLVEDVEDLKWKLKNRGIQEDGLGNTMHFVLAAYKMISGHNTDGALAPLARSIRYDIGRIRQALSMIDDMYSKWEQKELWSILADRFRYGIPAEMVSLVRLPKVGGVRARKMWDAGIKSLEDIVDAKKEMYQIFSPGVAKMIIQSAQSRLESSEV